MGSVGGASTSVRLSSWVRMCGCVPISLTNSLRSVVSFSLRQLRMYVRKSTPAVDPIGPISWPIRMGGEGKSSCAAVAGRVLIH